jgi:hypothetical protein
MVYTADERLAFLMNRAIRILKHEVPVPIPEYGMKLYDALGDVGRLNYSGENGEKRDLKLEDNVRRLRIALGFFVQGMPINKVVSVVEPPH